MGIDKFLSVIQKVYQMMRVEIVIIESFAKMDQDALYRKYESRPALDVRCALCCL